MGPSTVHPIRWCTSAGRPAERVAAGLGAVRDGVRRWAGTAPLSVVVAAAAAWTALAVVLGALLRAVTGWSGDGPWIVDVVRAFLTAALVAWLLLRTSRRSGGAAAQRAARWASRGRPLPSDVDPAVLRRALIGHRRGAAGTRRWAAPALGLGAAGLLWPAALDGATERWLAGGVLAAMGHGRSAGRLRPMARTPAHHGTDTGTPGCP